MGRPHLLLAEAPPFITRANRDEAFIRQLSEAVDQFNDELEALVAKYSQHKEFA